MDVPSATGRRTTVRRGGFVTGRRAEAALARLLDALERGVRMDPTETVAAYLIGWLASDARSRRGSTQARYRDYLINDVIPALGDVPLDDLARRHLIDLAERMLAAGRGPTTVHHCLLAVSAALTDAVRARRLPDNPALPAILHRPPRAREPVVWSAREAARFLRYCRTTDAFTYDLCTVIMGTGLRRGEALGLHFEDVDLGNHKIHVHHALTAVDNNRPTLGPPRTAASTGWIAISRRTAAAIRRRAQTTGRTTGLVFTLPDGSVPRPQQVLNTFHRLGEQAGLPRTNLKDLRHFTATVLLLTGVPLVVVSKLLRHASVATTADVYAHLTSPAAHRAARTLDRILMRAGWRLRCHFPHMRGFRRPRRLRPPGDHS